MLRRMGKDVKLQREYYVETANKYDSMRSHEEAAVGTAMDFMMPTLNRSKVQSILDIGSGKGRSLMRIKEQRPDIRSVGIEPVAKLRAIGHDKRILGRGSG